MAKGTTPVRMPLKSMTVGSVSRSTAGDSVSDRRESATRLLSRTPNSTAVVGRALGTFAIKGKTRASMGAGTGVKGTNDVGVGAGSWA